MTDLQRLLADQTRRLQALDPLLPPWSAPELGEVLVGNADGRDVLGVLLRYEYEPGSLACLWSAAQVSELVPLVGDTGRAGMDSVLGQWRDRLPRLALPDRDSACVVSWPSRDAEAGRALLDHGLVPLSVIAVRPPLPAQAAAPEAGVHIRLAGPEDLEACLELAVTEQAYSSLVGSAMARAEMRALKRSVLRSRLGRGAPVWLAERGGAVVGMVECGFLDVAAGVWTAARLPPGRWGYVNCASVLPGHRGRGVGQALVHRVHTAFAAADVVGSYLYYNPPNPLSSVFWPRQGYRPLWTIWEARPATALR